MTTLLVEALHKRVKVNEGGRFRSYTVLELLVRKIIGEASKGNVRLIEMLMSLPEPKKKTADSDVDFSKMTAQESMRAYLSIIKGPKSAWP